MLIDQRVLRQRLKQQRWKRKVSFELGVVKVVPPMYSPSHFCIVTPSPNWGVYFPDFIRFSPPIGSVGLDRPCVLALLVLLELGRASGTA
ncbi:hypothetical protein SynMEDNS5_01822 [Synechococcus sp. MEDNS5]|nr:hypothetical protein SynMEDNS5_01822 [Synechococcus sp. MEDNS5]